MSDIIRISNVTKTFSTAIKDPKRGSLANFFAPEKKVITAVDDISFSVTKGEALGFIGPNGAGKSTTIKMLTGILTPTVGDIRVCGYAPIDDRQRLAFRIGTLFGQRSQLISNLPLTDTFDLFGAMYELSERKIKARRKALVRTLELEEFMFQPVRKLSLGQRMRAEIAVALIHEPEIIFLDEPTIGLDVVAKKALRHVLADLNKNEGVTLFLTSHDAGDIEYLCERTIIVNHGRIMVDERTENLRRRYFTRKHVRLEVTAGEGRITLPGVSKFKREGSEISFVVDTSRVPLRDVLNATFGAYTVEDIDVTNPSLEEVIEAAYVRA